MKQIMRIFDTEVPGTIVTGTIVTQLMGPVTMS